MICLGFKCVPLVERIAMLKELRHLWIPGTSKNYVHTWIYVNNCKIFVVARKTSICIAVTSFATLKQWPTTTTMEPRYLPNNTTTTTTNSWHQQQLQLLFSHIICLLNSWWSPQQQLLTQQLYYNVVAVAAVMPHIYTTMLCEYVVDICSEHNFLAARRYASAVFATATCLSVCPSVTRRYCA